MASVPVGNDDYKIKLNNIGLFYVILNENAREKIELALHKERVMLNWKNDDGYTALHEAVRVGNIEAVRLLLERRADVTIKALNGKTPIDMAEEKLNSQNENDKAKWKLILSYHGILFQMDLIMLCSLNARNAMNIPFKIATEMMAVANFNNLVFIRPKEKTIRFFQAIHKKKDFNGSIYEIKIGDLMSIKTINDFCLQNYFISFCKIKHNEIFEGYELNDFSIVTNTHFEFEKPARNEKFNEIFLNNLENCLEKIDLKKDELLYIDDKRIEKYKFKDTFIMDGKLKAEMTNRAEINNLKLKDDEFDELFMEFFQKFHFITNYPNEQELSKIIYRKMSEQTNLSEANLPHAAFQMRINDFFKDYNEGKAKFVTSEDVDQFFDELKTEVRVPSVCGWNERFVSELRGNGIRFNHTYKPELQEFLSAENKKKISYFHDPEEEHIDFERMKNDFFEELSKIKEDNCSDIHNLFKNKTDKEILRLLNERDVYGRNSLDLAVEANSYDFLDLIIDQFDDEDSFFKYLSEANASTFANNIFLTWVNNYDENVIRKLLADQTHINININYSMKMLDWAYKNVCIHLIEELLVKTDSYKRNVLHAAIMHWDEPKGLEVIETVLCNIEKLFKYLSIRKILTAFLMKDKNNKTVLDLISDRFENDDPTVSKTHDVIISPLNDDVISELYREELESLKNFVNKYKYNSKNSYENILRKITNQFDSLDNLN